MLYNINRVIVRNICIISNNNLSNYLIFIKQYVTLRCDFFHSIRFKVNKVWSKALLHFFLPICEMPNEKPIECCFRCIQWSFSCFSIVGECRYFCFLY